MVDSATAQEIDTAMTYFKYRLTVPTLSQGTVKMVKRKLPGGTTVENLYTLTGAFARVYQITNSKGKERAVRCFYNTPRPEFHERYAHIADYFYQHLRTITADFQFYEKGIHIRTKPPQLVMPIIDMEWVEGETLLACVDRLAMKKDRAGLRRLATQWIDLLSQMRAAQMAHGDLSGTNVMVRNNGALVLIDYDGVYLPTFAGQNTDQAGHPAYQHREFLQKRKYDEMMDSFSALVIYVALYALSEKPDLWTKFTTHDPSGELTSEVLLFKQGDLADPDSSRLFRELSNIREPNFERVLLALSEACVGSIDDVLDFLDVVDPMGPQKRAFATLEKALKAKPQDYREIVKRAADPALEHYSPPQHAQIVAQVTEAKKRVAQADRIISFLRSQEDQKALQEYDSDGFSYTSIAREVTAGIQTAKALLAKLDKVKEALREQEDPEVLKNWDDKLFSNYHPARPYVKAVQEVQRRSAKLQPLFDALAVGRDLEVERLWGEILSEYPGPPSHKQAQFPAHLQKLLLKVQPVLGRVAAQRKAALDMLDLAIRNKDDVAVVGAAANPLLRSDNLPWVMRNAVGVARKHIADEQQIRSLIAAEDDSQALSCWRTNPGMHGTVIGKTLQPEIARVEKRLIRLTKLKQAINATNDERQDQLIVDAWNDAVFAGYATAHAYRKTYEDARARLELLKRFEEAITKEDAFTALQLWHELKAYRRPGAPGNKAIEAAQSRLDALRRTVFEGLIQAMRNGEDRDVVKIWSNPLLRDYAPARPFENEVLKSKQRVEDMAKLEKMAADPNNEEWVLATWEQNHFDNAPVAKPLRPTIDHIRRRRAVFKMLKEAADKGPAGNVALLSAWDERLFANYPPACQYEGEVREAQRTMSSDLTGLLTAISSGNDKLVIMLWDDLKVSKLPGAAPYESLVRAFKLRWLSQHVPKNLQGTLTKGVLSLMWDWPDDLTTVGIVVRPLEQVNSDMGSGIISGSMPTHAGRMSYNMPAPMFGRATGNMNRWVSGGRLPRTKSALPMWVFARPQYVSQGGYSRSVSKSQALLVSIFPLMLHNGDWLHEENVPSVSIEVHPNLSLIYTLVREGSNAFLEARVDPPSVDLLPALVVIASASSTPLNISAGSIVGRLGGPHEAPSHDARYRVKVDLTGCAPSTYISILPADSASASWLSIKPQGGVPIQVA